MRANMKEILRIALDDELDWADIDIRFGYDAAATTTSNVIWDKSGAAFVYPSAALVMKVSSDDATDTSAGVGARTILIEGIDADYNIAQEVVTLNGVTAVNTVTEFFRISDMRVLTAGASGPNTGNIYIGTGTVTAGVPATVYNFAGIDIGRSRATTYTVPAGYTGLMVTIEVAAERLADVKFTLCTRASTVDAPWVEDAKLPIFAGAATFDLPLPFRVPEKTDIELRAQTDSSTFAANGRFDMLIIKN